MVSSESGPERLRGTETMERDQLSTGTFYAHILVFSVYVISWVIFAIAVLEIYIKGKERRTEDFALTAFVAGVLTQALLNLSILYVIYLLFKNG